MFLPVNPHINFVKRVIGLRAIISATSTKFFSLMVSKTKQTYVSKASDHEGADEPVWMSIACMKIYWVLNTIFIYDRICLRKIL